MKKLFFLFLLFVTTLSWAHPHVFVDATINVLFDKSGLIGIKNHWVYDEIYSAAMFASADTDADGKLSEKENKLLEEEILHPLKSGNYYNHVLFKTEFLKAEGIKNFKASLVNGKLTLDFTIAFTRPAKNDYTMLVIVVNDPTNYVQVTADMKNSDATAPDEMDVEFFEDTLEGLSLMRAFRSDIYGFYLRYKK